MKVFSIAKGFHRLNKNAPPELTQKEQDRLRTIRLYKKTEDVELVCKTFEMSRATFYRWLKRFDPMDITTLKDKSRRPKKLRKPKWPRDVISKWDVIEARSRATAKTAKEFIETMQRRMPFKIKAILTTGSDHITLWVK